MGSALTHTARAVAIWRRQYLAGELQHTWGKTSGQRYPTPP